MNYTSTRPLITILALALLVGGAWHPAQGAAVADRAQFCMAAQAWLTDPALPQVQAALEQGSRSDLVGAMRAWSGSTSALRQALPASAPRPVRGSAAKLDRLVQAMGRGRLPKGIGRSRAALRAAPARVIDYIADTCR